MFYLFEIRDTDGNDCTVYDCIIEADSIALATELIHAHFEAFTSLESDGNSGYYRQCDCEVPEPPDTRKDMRVLQSSFYSRCSLP